jgi:LysM repeat protein
VPFHDRDFITFKAKDIGEVRVAKDENPPKIVGGYGGWEAVSRPKRTALSVWNGVDPIQLDVPVMFEGWGDRVGQEIRIGRLSRMALPQGDGEPPVVSIDGVGIPWHGRNRWVIMNIDWGDNVLWGEEPSSGSTVRFRQDAVVHLMQYVDDDRVAFSKLNSAKPGGGAWPKHYTWKKGDTLRKVASRFYHDSGKWKKIADANHIRDPKNIKVGRSLIIPKP